MAETSGTTRSFLPDPIAILLFPDFTAIAMVAVAEALRITNRYVRPQHNWRVISLDGKPVHASNGIVHHCDGSLSDAHDAKGTIILAAGNNVGRFATPSFLKWMKTAADQGVHFGGLDTAPLLLAHAGFLNGRRATMHWEDRPAAQESFPDIQFSSRLFEFDGPFFTCAGGIAAIDMMLHVIEMEHGRECAVRVSEHFIHDRIRSGAEPQRMRIPDRVGVHHPKLIRTIELMESHIGEPLAPNGLAEGVGLSPRHLALLFREHLNVSPGQFYLDLRLDHARQMLLHSEMSVVAVSLACGFQSQSHFSRVYRQRFGFAPRSERRPVQHRQSLTMDAPTHFPREDSPGACRPS